MKHVLLLMFALAATGASARIFDLFTSWEELEKLSTYIVVLQCSKPIPPVPSVGAANSDAEIQVIFNLKGTNNVTPVRLQTNHELHFGEKYLVFGDCGRGNISAYEEYRVVPLPATFSTNELRGTNLNEQVECLLSLRLFNLQNELAPLLEEEQRIAPVVSNSRLQRFDSAGPVTLGEIHEATTQRKVDSIPWLEFGTNQLDWSGCELGKSGYFYCSVQWRTLWEFASCTATNLADFEGKPLLAKFYGEFTPNRQDSGLVWTAPNAILASVGQIFLARTVLEPQRIYIVQVKSQKQSEESVAVRYAIIKHEYE